MGEGNGTTRAVQQGIILGRINGAQAIVAYTKHQERRNLSPNTVYARRIRLERFAEWLAPRDILDAAGADIEGWIDHRGVSPQTQYGYVSIFAAFYAWAVQERLLRRNPADRVARPKLPRRVPRPIGDDDLAVAVEMADDRMRCWLLLAAFAGFRCAEITELRVEDIHPDRAVVMVHGKGNKERLVPLHPDLYSALLRYGLPRSGYVFKRRDGRPMRPATVSAYVGRYLRSLGIDATCHRGRHAFATNLYRVSGGDLRMVQECLGHASPVTTAAYAAWEPAKAAAAVEQLGLRAPTLASANGEGP